MEMMTIDQVDGIKGAIENARNDDTPFAGVIDDELHVIGNPNNTEVKPADYVVYFAFPNTKEWREQSKLNGDIFIKETDDKMYFFCKREYRSIYLSPRNVGSAVTAFTLIESFIHSISDNGEIRELKKNEMMALLNTMNHELSDEAYHLVSAVFRIPYDEQEWMLPINTMENAIKIAYNNPSMVNEADLLFGQSPEEV